MLPKNKQTTCKFCRFVKGKSQTHANGLPFLTLHRTRHSIAFQSEDLPQGKDAHILVIPKAHYPELTNMPPEVLHDVIDHVQLAARIITKTHGGCNVLLNNGKSAGQYVFHAHFHIIPRDAKDHIEIERWKRVAINRKKFLALHEKLKKQFQHVSVRPKSLKTKNRK